MYYIGRLIVAIGLVAPVVLVVVVVVVVSRTSNSSSYILFNLIFKLIDLLLMNVGCTFCVFSPREVSDHIVTRPSASRSHTFLF